MDKPIFLLNNVVYKTGQETILNIKNFEFHRGACYMISGEMGSGKTTILDIMNKNKNISSGEVYYEQNLLSKISKTKYSSDVMYVEQISKKPYFKTVRQYLYQNVKKINQTDKIDKLIKNIVTIMDMKYLLDKKVRSLTPSQFRWVELAAKIASFPKVLFIDEIEQHLSINKIKILNKILYRKCNYEGVTVIATTQNKEYFSSLISVNININHGRITSVRSFSSKKRKKS